MASDPMVHCKACGEGFRIPTKVEEATFLATAHEFAGKAYQCSKCGQKRVYDAVDHYFR
jgi:DNA-directed RNA polymerase subunit RPC12/RpoP